MSEQTRTEITITGELSTGIEAMGKRKEIREVVQRIKLMSPGGLKLKDDEALALAQYAYSMNLNPLNGEVWFIPTIGTVVGIKGFRRKAQIQAQENGEHFSVSLDILTDPDMLRLHEVPEGSLAYYCDLSRSNVTDKYTTNLLKLIEAGMSSNEAKVILGQSPLFRGIGYVTREEMAKLDKNNRNSMSHAQRAMKRAETHAIKMAFYIPFGNEGRGDDKQGGKMLEDYIVESSWSEVEKTLEVKPEEMVEAAIEASDELFGTSEGVDDGLDRIGHKFDIEIITQLQGMFPECDQHPDQINAVMNLAPLGPAVPVKEFARWIKFYVAARYDMDKDMKAAQAFANQKFDEAQDE